MGVSRYWTPRAALLDTLWSYNIGDPPLPQIAPRAGGAAEDSGPVEYHKAQIAKMQDDLASENPRSPVKSGSRKAEKRPAHGRDASTSGGGGEPPSPPRQDSPIDYNEDPADRLSRLFADQTNNATRGQRASVLRWQGKDERYYEQVQQAARGNDASPSAVDVAYDLQELMAPLPEPVEVWRGIRDAEKTFGVPADLIEQLVDREMENPAFFATSLDRKVAEHEFTRPGSQPAIYKIAARAGTPLRVRVS